MCHHLVDHLTNISQTIRRSYKEMKKSLSLHVIFPSNKSKIGLEGNERDNSEEAEVLPSPELVSNHVIRLGDPSLIFFLRNSEAFYSTAQNAIGRSQYSQSSATMSGPFASIEYAVASFKKNHFLIVMDDESRENEGDLICAAEGVTQEQMAFLVRHSSGYVCAPMSNETADRLDLPLLRELNCEANDDDRHGTAYTITCDYAAGTTTGISAHDRALTCRKLAESTATATDFLKPGHVVPLRAVDGGVLKRGGHTEAAVDLCKLAGKAPVAVICELVKDSDGMMMRLNDCVAFGKAHGIELITIEQLKSHIQRNMKEQK